MPQKSVSIRANVSIRGVTIRAYALHFDSNLLRLGLYFDLFLKNARPIANPFEKNIEVQKSK